MKPLVKIIFMLPALLALNLAAQTNSQVKLSGTVVDSQGKPVEDASVDYYSYPMRAIVGVPETESAQHTTTDAKGAFAFSVPSSAGTLVAQKAGLAPGWKSFQTTPTSPAEPLVLKAPSGLAGVVVDEKGQPVANANIIVAAAMDRAEGEGSTQPNLLFSKAARDLFSARTGADGRFRIANFPAGSRANLNATLPGHALRVPPDMGNGLQFDAQAGQEDIKLVMDPAGSIEGTVVFHDTGAPVAGARIQLQLAGGLSGMPQTIHSAADGTFRVSGLSAGSYRVMAFSTNDPASWVAPSVAATVQAGETARGVKIEAVKGGVMEVTVVEKQDGNPLADMTVSAYSEGYQAQATTKSNGVATLRLPAGEFSFNAWKPGMSQLQAQGTVTEGQTSNVRLEMEAPQKIIGTIRDSSGSPVAGASVGIYPNYGGGNMEDVKSDGDGHYEVAWQKPNWAGAQNQSFYLVARNVERKLAAVHEVPEKTTTLDLELKPGMTLSGRVQDIKGKAITNLNAYFELQMENTTFTVTRQDTQPDSDGRVHIDAMPMGERYMLFVNAKGYGNGQENMDSPSSTADHYDFPPLVLKQADRKLMGRVLGTNGQGVAGVRVFIYGEGQPNGNAMTDSNGRFALDVCDGVVMVQAQSGQFFGNSQAMGGDTNVVIRFNGNNRVYSQMNSLTLTGTVFDQSGSPAVGAHVVVVPAWGMADAVTTDANGEYTIHWQDQPGARNIKYVVVARDADRNLAGVESIDSKTTRVSIKMEPGFSISGTVLDQKGDPLTRANVYLNLMAGNNGGMLDQRNTRVASDGTFTITALPMGQQYNVNVMANGYGRMNKSISKTQSQTNSIQLSAFHLRAADLDLAGHVFGTDGKPLSGVQVYTYGNNQPNVNANTDATGHFKVKVCEGPVSVQAYMQNGGGGRANFASVQVRGGDMNVVLKMGQNQQAGSRRSVSLLKPQLWSLSALIVWPREHKTTAIILLSLQMGVLLGAGGVVFWMSRKRGT